MPEGLVLQASLSCPLVQLEGFSTLRMAFSVKEKRPALSSKPLVYSRNVFCLKCYVFSIAAFVVQVFVESPVMVGREEDIAGIDFCNEFFSALVTEDKTESISRDFLSGVVASSSDIPFYVFVIVVVTGWEMYFIGIGIGVAAEVEPEIFAPRIFTWRDTSFC